MRARALRCSGVMLADRAKPAFRARAVLSAGVIALAVRLAMPLITSEKIARRSGSCSMSASFSVSGDLLRLIPK